MRSFKQKVGDVYEQKALTYLKKQGLKQLEQNFSCSYGEIDLIMRQGEEIAFVEVRYRANHSFGGAAASVNKTKQQRLIKTAHYWIKLQNCQQPSRFDIVAISDDSIEWIPGAFEEQL